MSSEDTDSPIEEISSSSSAAASQPDHPYSEDPEERYSGLLKKKPLKMGGRLGQIQQQYHRPKSNSTSTLYVNSTVSTPDVNELLRCTAIKIFGLVQSGTSGDRIAYEIFDERKHAISNDCDFGQLPTEKKIYDFIESIFKAERLSHECAIMMLAYIERIVELAHVLVDATNWRRIILSTLILASKVWEDQAVWNVDFLSVFPQVTVKDLGNLEKVLLKLLQYNVSLKSSVYTKYYFELRTLAERDENNFPLEPLDKKGAKRLEQRSKSEEDRVKADVFAHAARSKSMTEIQPLPKARPVVLN